MQASMRRKRNHISQIKDDSGAWVNPETDLSKIFVQDFKKRFTPSFTPGPQSMNNLLDIIAPCISTEMNLKLVAPVSEDEISGAIFSIGSLKAPSPDGLHALFFQKYWNEVKPFVTNVIHDFFINCTSLHDINKTNIALIPKVEIPETVANFRPISLCNVIYKVISKIIVNRLRPILLNCISQNQGAFAPGRSIIDNILIAHELFSDFNRKKGHLGAMAVKLHLEKAYDFLDWNYIKAVLSKFGFCGTWINLIMECITSVSFSVLVNGKPEGNFKPLRGIRQGDPLSPYIFILCMEPLIRTFNVASQRTKHHIGLLSSPHGLRISNLMFADDCLIFGKASKVGARRILKILDDFSVASGQKINFHKSSLYFSNNVSYRD